MSENEKRKPLTPAQQRPSNPDGPDMAFDPIAAALRQLHEKIAAEDIPDDFLDLLDQLNDAPDSESSAK